VETDRALPARRPRILLIVDDCGLGDALRASFCLGAVRRQFPESEMVLLVGEEAYPAFERSEMVDRIVISRLYKPRGRWRGPSRLRKFRYMISLTSQLGMGYDLLIAFNWGSTFLHILMWVVGRRGRRVGYSRSFASLLTDSLGPYHVALTKLNTVEQNLALLRAAGVDATMAGAAIARDRLDQLEVDRLLQVNGIRESNPIIVLHPGSHWPCQQWHPERWAQLADELQGRYMAEIVFTGDSHEDDLIEEIRGRMRTSATSFAGQTTLAQLMVLLSRAQFCVCVNSAIFELTQAAAIRTIALAGPSEPQIVSMNSGSPIVINETDAETRKAINRSRRRLMIDGQSQCFNYECPLAYLPDIKIADVLRAADQMLTVPATRVG
jgi:ADP-heptose:LPS heptosyltransferase